MSRLLRYCTVHHVAEVLPGVWTRARGRVPGARHLSDGHEAACPTCLALVQASLQRQFPYLYGPVCQQETPHAS
jgi:hypothetical protein